ncbi:hypothetical protein BDK51DRAFT_30676 [Blyttiomyces helicus]|uniref:HECT-type E3 ubiquitin transferase n=1 Tax=Blyttiomyces helicus TaxID=388810 RepID=A0A4P9W2L4_9FUNG|nr:hypothetical protein BDK51DRAFT_30676 [Blyttiomyces helicus]|eukprot:RKO86384.1 hypothetical protein BDK51DRAFT_30676 [Blyttiomyces helicus]
MCEPCLFLASPVAVLSALVLTFVLLRFHSSTLKTVKLTGVLMIVDGSWDSFGIEGSLPVLCAEVVAADGLFKRDVFRLPDPFAVVTVDAEQTHTTSVIKRTLNPYWNESFDITVSNTSVIAVQIFDHKKWKKTRDQGFLGVINTQIGNIFDINTGGDEMLTLELKKSNSTDVVSGKLIMNVSTVNVYSPPASAPTPTVESTTAALANVSVGRTPSVISNNSSASSAHPSTLANIDAGSSSSAPPPTVTHFNPTLGGEMRKDGIRIPPQPQNGSSSSSASPANRALSSVEDSMGPLPSGWERRVDHLNRSYYVDHNTRTTTWIRPTVSGTNPNAASDDQRNLTEQERQRHQNRSLPGGGGDGAPPSMNTPSAGTLTTASPSPVPSPTPSTPAANLGPLPNGWEQRVTPEGRAYYVDHNTRTTTWLDPRRVQQQGRSGTGQQLNAGQAAAQLALAQQTSRATLGALPGGWEMRLTNTGRVYYVDHNAKITTWDDPRLPSSLDQNVPQYKRDFRRKLVYFRSQPAMRPSPGQCHVTVRRATIFEDAYTEIMRYPASELKKRLMIKFAGEDGLDYGGLSREFFFLLSHEMFNPFYCLFEYSAHDNYTLQINPHSSINPEHLNYFKFIGRVVGLAIFHQRFLDAFFITALYKMILRKKINIKDMESVDSEMWRSLQWML